jgi:serine/threonine-protein kinase
MAIVPGTQIDRYHIIEPLGQGGMAEVYKAFDTRLEREVAIKVIRRNAFSPDVLERVLKRFDREAKSLAKLTHPNIVSIIDYGEYEGSPFLVMPFLPGGTLKARLGKPMPYAEAAALLCPIADALAYAHQKGIIHRDVKPGNILITEGGQPMLTDFGIARLLDNEETQTLTGTGVGVGTPEYMAPEQGLGREVDGRADIYSLGIVFYELVTGQKPYSADTPMAIILKQSTEPLPSPSAIQAGIPEQVDKTLFKALAKKPEDRYLSMVEFESALEQVRAGMSIQTERKEKHVKENVKPDVVVTSDTLGTEIKNIASKKTRKIGEQNASIEGKKQEPAAIENGIKSKKGIWASLGALALIVLILIIGNSTNWFKGIQATEAPTVTSSITFTKTSEVIATSFVTATPEFRIGSIMVSPIDGMEMVFVPAGEFIMGSPDGVGGDYEHPQHTVYLDAYWIDQTEVTNGKYAKCVAAGACSEPSAFTSYTRISYFGNSDYDEYPVIYVSWLQAQEYCKWVGRVLPSEAQWEKASRGEDGQTYPWGEQKPEGYIFNLVNVADQSTNVEWKSYFSNDGYGDTAPVESFTGGASPYGALNMAGNVWEWVADWYSASFYSSSPNSNPSGPSSGESRVLRGGSWYQSGYYVRSATRGNEDPSYSFVSTGFRCALPAN